MGKVIGWMMMVAPFVAIFIIGGNHVGYLAIGLISGGVLLFAAWAAYAAHLATR